MNTSRYCVLASISLVSILGCDSPSADDTPLTTSDGGIQQASGVHFSGTGESPALGFPASDMGTAISHAASNGSLAFHGGAWVIPLPPQQPGASISEVDATVTGPDNGGGVRVELISSVAGSLNFTTPPSVGVPVIAHVAVAPWRVIAAGETLQLVISPKDASGVWASADTTISGMQVLGPRALVPTTVNIPVIYNRFAAGFISAYDSENISTHGGIGYIVNGVPVGATISAIRAKISDNPGASVSLGLSTKEMPTLAAPSWTDRGPRASSAGNGAIQQLTASGIGYVVGSDTELAVTVTSNGVSVTPLITYSIEMDYN